MRIHELQFLFDYNYWTRDRILEVAAKLSTQQLLEAKPYAHGSMRNTLVHILSAEWVWRVRCQEGISPPALYRFEDYPSVEIIRQAWQQEEERMRTYLRSLSDMELDRVVPYTRINGDAEQNVLWRLLVHVVNHGTEHRSILAAELTGYGHSPGDVDIVHFMRVAKL